MASWIVYFPEDSNTFEVVNTRFTYLLRWSEGQYTIKKNWELDRGEYETGWYRATDPANLNYQHPSPLEAWVTSNPETSLIMKGSRNHADELIIERQFKPLNYKLSTLTVNLQTELDVNQPDLIKPSPQLRDSPALRIMSLQQAATALWDISNPLDIVASSPPPVYTLTHLLGLRHNIMPLAAPMPQELPLQVAATTVQQCSPTPHKAK